MTCELAATTLTGYPLAEARARLAALGCAIEDEIEVCPPGEVVGSGEPRVIMTLPTGAGIRLFWAHQTYRRISDRGKP